MEARRFFYALISEKQRGVINSQLLLSQIGLIIADARVQLIQSLKENIFEEPINRLKQVPDR
ncbi:hypothetical protein DWB61_17785 [Ancylomarina euxinus]|uniref:Uncharacterized protein n=2 Tax=Ancylomarina euxinus TaxID=2283627 RepID=A0A425XWA3_9BACT|nr:hypothetical protein DWB61_17785 [Ancylomarina euxinus]